MGAGKVDPFGEFYRLEVGKLLYLKGMYYWRYTHFGSSMIMGGSVEFLIKIVRRVSFG